MITGAEIAGIKMHAAIDTIIRKNHIHNCMRGLWLDWQAQGTWVTKNLFHDNTLPLLEQMEGEVSEEMMQGLGEDLFIEVTHGPTLIDHNLFLSARAMKLACQGFAAVHNLIAGGLVDIGIGTENGAKTKPSSRYTPYHMPHRTEVAGFMTFLHGDARFYNNIFVQQKIHPAMQKKTVKLVKTDTLGRAFEPEQAFETPDGEAIVFDTDYFGKKICMEDLIAGPFADGKEKKLLLFPAKRDKI